MDRQIPKRKTTVYGFEKMNVGDIIPCKLAPSAAYRERIEDRLRSLRVAAHLYGKRHGKRFSVRHLKEARHWAHIERTR